ncbi:MAG TPA: TlpA disulfide reductase family protein [Spirochaetia bacterium]|nr:TlpA disulfide reductase family protein [Spirochaetia bacterium]
MKAGPPVRAFMSGAVLILIGFSLGVAARPAIQSWTTRLKGSIAQNAEERKLTRTYLGKAAPPIETVSVSGTSFRLEQQHGKVVLLFFWASWCSYSRAAIPEMKALAARYADRDDFRIVGISLDREREALTAYVQGNSIPWENLFENGRSWQSSAARAYSISSIPSRWVVDKEGRIRGVNLSEAETEDMLSLVLEGRHRRPVPATTIAPQTGGSGAAGCTGG